ncbi:hypothetical protein SAMD00019534_066250 [Acytostelium subglobosum LB1]|uniref:hypothetical protein n=1 Tax=Acytostelium subglobosum LB1 TaxID=1410327 RepID=UPI000644A400|nr:hypothetical protein SAMD00019534_066250 [Acytostelium subglobosum LB1]GAM23450.1 hypothetical protein SAMD00019534_066250 [Acytostelium subglobosum LB1]|eukprot:XP_012753899.1 hypothetical protein SAMD00019534_066250 [Acytostelium subglobosum LB1]
MANERGESPLILFLIIKLLELIGFVFAFVALPFTLYSRLVFWTIKNQDILKSRKWHLILGIPRVLVLIPFFPWALLALSYLYSLQLIGLVQDTEMAGHPLVGPLATFVCTLIVNSIGYTFTGYKFASFKPEFKRYFEAVGECLLDVGAAVSLVATVCTVIRIPFLVYTLVVGTPTSVRHSSQEHLKSYRAQLYCHALLIIPDLLCLPILLLSVIFHWRFRDIKAYCQRHNYTAIDYSFSIDVRLCVLVQLFMLVINILEAIASVLLILVPYRIPIAYRLARASQHADQALGEVFWQACEGLLDIIVFALFLVFLVPTVYRVPITIRQMRAQDRAGLRRETVIKHILLIFLDILATFCGACLLATIYRLPSCYRQLKEDRFNHYHSTIFREWVYLIVDIPYIVMALTVICTVWRAFFMYRDIQAATSRSQRHKAISDNFSMLFVDIIDTPFVICSLAILLTGWRAYHFIQAYPPGAPRKTQRIYILKQFLMLVLDIPTLAAFIILMVTVYRAKDTLNQLKSAKLFTINRRQATSASAPPAPPTLPPSSVDRDNDEDENPAPSTTMSETSGQLPLAWHPIVGKQFFLLLLDIPFPVLFLLTLWRMPMLYSRLKEIDDSEPERRYTQQRLLILRYVLAVLMDIICLVPLAFIVITMWRIPSLWRMIKQHRRGDNEHRAVAILFQKTLIDVPFALLGLCTIVMPWRFMSMARSLLYKEFKSDMEARVMVLGHFGLIFVDLFIIILATITLVTGWRIMDGVREYKRYLRDNPNNEWKYTWAAIHATGLSCTLILLDLLAVLQILCITVIMIRLPQLIKALRNNHPVPLPPQEVYSRNRRRRHYPRKVHPVIVPMPAATSDDHSSTSDESKSEPAPAPVVQMHTISWRAIIAFYFMETLRDIPNIVLLPLKVAGIAFIPIHIYLARRTQSNKISSLNDAMLWLHRLAIHFSTVLEFDKFTTVNMLGCLLIVPNEMAMALVAINSIYLFIVTLGSPLWSQWRVNHKWTKLGDAKGMLSILETIIALLQATTFPFYVCLQLVLATLPLYLFEGPDNHPVSTANQTWRMLIQDPRSITLDHLRYPQSIHDYWMGVTSVHSQEVRLMHAGWMLIMFLAWTGTTNLARLHVPLYAPIQSYVWIVRKVFVGRFWKLYRGILARGTYRCFQLRHTMFIGELLMFPLFVVWTFSPLAIPRVVQAADALGITPFVLMTLFLCFKSYDIIKQAWSEPVDISKLDPLIILTAVNVRLPESGGIVVTLEGTRRESCKDNVDEAYLQLESKPLWRAIEGLFGRTKIRLALMVIGYPISLCPRFMDNKVLEVSVDTIGVSKEQEHVDGTSTSTSSSSTSSDLIKLDISIGIQGQDFKLAKTTICNIINDITKKDDPLIDVIIEYGNKKTKGLLCRFNTKLSSVLECRDVDTRHCLWQPTKDVHNDTSSTTSSSNDNVGLRHRPNSQSTYSVETVGE